MRTRTSQESLSKSRTLIGAKLRILRDARHWSQADVAARLHLSQPQLSNVERGEASLTAEQFLEALKIFNVGPSMFVAPDARVQDSQHQELQKALSRFGARHLYADERILPSEQLAQLQDVTLAVLISGEPRLLTALAPVLASNANLINFAKLSVDLDGVGLRGRLYWVMENTIAAIRSDPKTDRALKLAAQRLERALRFGNGYQQVQEPDLIDKTISTAKGEEQVRRLSSSISQKWKVVTTLQPSDFADALRESRERA